MPSINGQNCCGAIELVGINDVGWTPKIWLKYYAQQYQTNMNPTSGKAWVVFSYAWDVSKGATITGTRTCKQGKTRLAAWKKYIEDNGLGTVTIAPTCAFNPNYGTRIRIRSGLWVPKNEAISEFVIKQKMLKGPTKVQKLGGLW